MSLLFSSFLPTPGAPMKMIGRLLTQLLSECVYSAINNVFSGVTVKALALLVSKREMAALNFAQ